MKYYPPSEHIYYPDSDVPKNKLDIRDSELIHEIEGTLLLGAYEHFHTDLSEETRFDVTYFKEVHRYLFDRLYDWAGDYRTVNISKAESMFCPYINLESFSKDIFEQLRAEDYLRDLEDLTLRDHFTDRLAYYMCELIVLHPFNEGNGRALRLFIDMIATYNGYDYIDYADTLDDNAFISASVDCMEADYTKMRTIISAGLSRQLSIE